MTDVILMTVISETPLGEWHDMPCGAMSNSGSANIGFELNKLALSFSEIQCTLYLDGYRIFTGKCHVVYVIFYARVNSRNNTDLHCKLRTALHKTNHMQNYRKI